MDLLIFLAVEIGVVPDRFDGFQNIPARDLSHETAVFVDYR